MKVSVRSLVGATMIVDNAEPSDTFAILKSKIEAKFGIPAVQLRLLVDEEEPGDDLLLNDCGITDEAVIHYIRRSVCQIQVTGFQGTKATIVLEKDSTVRDLRAKIASTPGVALAMEFQLVMFANRQIESKDASTLEAEGFRTDSVNLVTVTSRTRGGH